MTHDSRFFAKVSMMATLLCSLALSPARAEAQPAFLGWAEELVDHVAPANNLYDTGPFYVSWAGVNGAIQYENRTLCSNFLTALLMHAYGLTSTDIRDWTGSTSPNAALYHDLILAEDGFTRIDALADIEPGDVIAIRYESGTTTSGHISMAEAAPVLRAATKPLVAGTQQYEVHIIDSTRKGHGAGDSRLQADGTWDEGAGRGVMRFYADASGAIVGHTWSLSPHSTYHDVSFRSVAVGRFIE